MLRTKDGASGVALLLGTGISFGTVPVFVTWLTDQGASTWFQLAARLANN